MLKAYLKKFEGKTSQKVYFSEIRQFFKFYQGSLGDLKKKDFEQYLDHLGKRAKAKTIKRKFSILNQFCGVSLADQPRACNPVGSCPGEKADHHQGSGVHG